MKEEFLSKAKNSVENSLSLLVNEQVITEQAKQEALERIVRTTIIASNTSTFSIARLIEQAKTPQRIIITHFFNPAQLVPLVEIVRHEKTADEVVSAVMDLMVKIGKSPVLLKKDVPGFIANRLQAALMREAFSLLKDGVADAREIDTVMKDGLGFRWAFVGPIETADFGGLDTWVDLSG